MSPSNEDEESYVIIDQKSVAPVQAKSCYPEIHEKELTYLWKVGVSVINDATQHVVTLVNYGYDVIS